MVKEILKWLCCQDFHLRRVRTYPLHLATNLCLTTFLHLHSRFWIPHVVHSAPCFFQNVSQQNFLPNDPSAQSPAPHTGTIHVGHTSWVVGD